MEDRTGTRTLLVFDGDGNYLNKNLFGFTNDSVFLVSHRLLRNM